MTEASTRTPPLFTSLGSHSVLRVSLKNGITAILGRCTSGFQENASTKCISESHYRHLHSVAELDRDIVIESDINTKIHIRKKDNRDENKI